MNEPMRHFSNGTEWIKQSANYCERCVNNRDRHDGRGVGCPIDDIHMECSDQEILDQVIPDSLLGDRYEFMQCSMFLERCNHE